MTSPDQDSALDQQLAVLVRHSRRYIWLLLAVLCTVVLALVAWNGYLQVAGRNATLVNTAQIAANQQTADHRWCSTLSLLTQDDPPAAAPLRQVLLYARFMELRREFGCSRLPI